MQRWFLASLALALVPLLGRAEVTVRPVEYRQGETVFEGCLIADEASKGKRPAVLLAHEAGPNSVIARTKGTGLAKLGYVVLSVDLYGKTVRPRDAEDAAAKAGVSGKDRETVRARGESAWQFLAKQKDVDSDKIAAVGYGVGGTAMLELARSGAEIEGVVCLHGDLSTPVSGEDSQVACSVLVLVGADDPRVPPGQIAAFEKEMRSGGVDWQVVRYGGAVHDFTNPMAGRDVKRGTAYDATAARRADDAVRLFLAEQLPPSKEPPRRPEPKIPAGVPAKVMTVLKYVDDKGKAPEGYEGGRTFLNIEKNLPQTDGDGLRIKYREWDVNPHKPGVNRGAERLVTGSDGSAHYTDDHYRSFKKLR